MPNPTIPLASGGERELRDVEEGWFVKLACGAVLPTSRNTIGDRVCEDEPIYCSLAFGVCCNFPVWGPDGKCKRVADGSCDIVLILGQAEETHGDGTVTKLITWPITSEHGCWEEFEIVHLEPSWRFKPKPIPSPTYTEKLIEAVKTGEVVLPYRAVRLTWDGSEWGWCSDNGVFKVWNGYDFGPLPPWQPGDETSIDLATVREAAEVRHG